MDGSLEPGYTLKSHDIMVYVGLVQATVVVDVYTPMAILTSARSLHVDSYFPVHK